MFLMGPFALGDSKLEETKHLSIKLLKVQNNCSNANVVKLTYHIWVSTDISSKNI